MRHTVLLCYINIWRRRRKKNEWCGTMWYLLLSSSLLILIIFILLPSSCKKGEMVIVIILDVSNLGTRQTVCIAGKISKLASLITHLSAPDRQLYWNSAAVSPHQLTNNDTNNISLLLLRCCRCACRGQQLFDLTSHMRNDVDQRSAKRAHSVR